MESQTEYGRRVLESLKYANITETELATKIGSTQQNINHLIKKGKSSKLTVQIAEVCGVNTHWLATGERQMIDQVADAPHQYKDSKNLPIGEYEYIKTYKVPFSAGSGHTPDEYEELGNNKAIHRKDLAEWGLNGSDLNVVYVQDDSMMPRLHCGDQILIKITSTTIKNGNVYAMRYGKELRVKRLEMRYDGALVINSDNSSPEFKQEIIPKTELDQIAIIGRVVRVISSKV